MTRYFWRAFAAADSSARYASSASRLTRHTPLRPIFNAGSSPLRISVYTCDTVTLSTPATSAGFSQGFSFLVVIYGDDFPAAAALVALFLQKY